MPQSFYPIKPGTFLYLGFQIWNKEEQYGRRCFATEYRHFRAHFGVSPSTCALVWKAVSQNRYILPPKATPQHLLWALLYLKLYDADEVLSDIVGVDVKTFRKWSWAMVEAIAKVKPQIVSGTCQTACLIIFFCRTDAVGFFRFVFNRSFGHGD